MAHRRVDREGRGRGRLTGWRFELASLLTAAPEDVWARVGTIDGVNLELAPWLRMTAPRDARRLEDLPLGHEAFRSWLLLLGVVPVEVDRLCLVRVVPLHGFLERSRLVTQRSWSHERTLERRPEGTLVVDRVEAVPRWPVAARWQRRAVLAVFRHRHRQLRAAFGAG